MHKHIFACLFILCCIITLNTTDALAQITSKPFITLDNKTSSVSLNKRIYITPDPNNQYSAKDIALRFQNNIRGIKNNKNNIVFDYKSYPYWIVFQVKNKTQNNAWSLDFGTLDNGRSSNLQKLIIYDEKQNEIKQIATNATKSRFNLQILPQSTSLFIIRLQPSIQKQLVLNLSLNHGLKHVNAKKFNLQKILIDNIEHIIILSICVSVLGLIFSKFTALIPIIIYYICYFIWFRYLEHPIVPSLSQLNTIIPITPLLNALIITLSCLLSIPGKYKDSLFRIILFFMSLILIIAMIYTVLFIPTENIISPIITNGLSLTTLIIAVLFLFSQKNLNSTPFAIHLPAWIGLMIIGNVIVIATSLNLLPHSFITNNAAYLVLYPQLILIFLSVVTAVKGYQNQQIRRVIQKANKTQSLLKAQKSKESSDHSRLLRVIEREREIMEELRERESERAEEMRQAKVSADEANDAKSAFLAVVSHEIRTPMTGVMGMIRLLENTSLSNEQKDYVLTVKDSGDAMVSLLNDILDFSKIEDGGMTIEKINFDLQRVTNSVIMLMKGHADQKNIDLILDIQDNVPTNLYGDPTRLRQIFLNLIGNALKFTSKGHVALRIKIDVNSEKNNSENNIYAVNFSIEDTGIGISEEAQQNLFNPFSQADSSISRKYGGTGLGLAICKRLVEAMGGEIKITSREGSGASFSFTIPLKSETNEHQSKNINNVEKKQIPDVSKHFLIVDDNEVNRKVMTALLSQKSHTFVTAENGTTALKILEHENEFDGIFLDIEMPDINGKEVAKRILNNQKTCDIPIIALTGNVSDSDVLEYKTIGFKKHLAKPINPNNLYDIISNINDIDMNNILTKDPIVEIKEDKNPPLSSNKIKQTLDQELLKGLKDGLGITQTKSLLNDLFEKTDEIIEQIKKAIEINNEDDLGARAHELKGMAGNFGLKAVSDKAGQIEKSCREGKYDQETMSLYEKDLSILFERSKIALDKFLDN